MIHRAVLCLLCFSSLVFAQESDEIELMVEDGLISSEQVEDLWFREIDASAKSNLYIKEEQLTARAFGSIYSVSGGLYFRQKYQENIVRSGFVAAGFAGLELIAGKVIAESGMGLVIADPGRWRSMSATSPLKKTEKHIRGSTSTSTQAESDSYSLGYQTNWLRGAVIVEAENLNNICGYVSTNLGPARSTVTISKRNGGQGASIFGSIDSSSFAVQSEIASFRRDRYAVSYAHSSLFSYSGKKGKLELLTAVSDPGFQPDIGRVPVVLPQTGGSGLALRWYYKCNSDINLSSLFANSQSRYLTDTGYAVARKTKIQTGISLKHDNELNTGGIVVVDYNDKSGWQSIAQWLPRSKETETLQVRLGSWAQKYWHDYRTKLVVKYIVKENKYYLSDEVTPMESRLLFNIRVDRQSASGFGVKFEYGHAWGDELDIVTVSVPSAGQMRSFHWSKRNDLWLVSFNHKSKSGIISLTFDKSTVVPSKSSEFSTQLYWQKNWK